MPDNSFDTKTFVKDDETAAIVCPFCTTAKSIHAGRYRDSRHIVAVRCRCGKDFRILLDFRRHHRKPTDLAGAYMMMPPASGGGEARVKNVSLHGVGFQVHNPRGIEIGQKAVLEFTLDNRKATSIKKKLTIRSINGRMIGGEFHQDQAFDKDLGFYVRF